MKRIWLSVCMFATLAMGVWTPLAMAQQPQSGNKLRGYFTVRPLTGVTTESLRAQSETATTIPLWSYTITSRIDNNPYSGTMVGRSPFFHGARATNIPTVIVPLVIKMPDGGVFDPSQPDTKCSPAGSALSLVQGSPIVNSAPSAYTMNGINVGNGQYIDAFQRANFFNATVSATGNSYHTTLGPVTTASPVTVNIASGNGATTPAGTFGNCAPFGTLDDSFDPNTGRGKFENMLDTQVIPNIPGVGPTTIPILLMYNVVQTQGGTDPRFNCCILGFHSGFNTSKGPQFYGISDFDTAAFGGDTSVLAHEVGELIDDPIGNNGTPLWGHVGQVSGCQNNLEVGDPLSPGGNSATNPFKVKMPNGFTYTLQELAFFSWFYRQSPSIGSGGKFSDNGTFTTDAGAVCM